MQSKSLIKKIKRFLTVGVEADETFCTEVVVSEHLTSVKDTVHLRLTVTWGP